MSHLDDWQLFSARYGLIDHDDQVWHDKQPWGSRHRRIRADANVRHWCRCAGVSMPSATKPCGLAVTQEDGLCDECRHWCVAVDRQDRYHLIADLPVAAASSGGDQS